ncbi:EamA family transporter [Halocynthiibacter namhaensis]|uniref:EamA family transporter n=1 Tax=Halocynthiibacter namhaensis TaxID=1290553 RepID=UPI001EE1B5FF|nr:EamA family transporter [Halocynthiibacter namhaensis]
MSTVSRIGTQNNNQAMAWALMATGMFAITAVMAKYGVIELGMHVLQILFVRQMIVFLSSLPLIARDFPHSLKTQHPVIHVVRLGGAFLSLSCGIWAVAELPLTTATTLGFAQVFFVAILAMMCVGERVGPHRLGAIVCCRIPWGVDCNAPRH